MDKRLLVATLLALFLVPFLAVGRAEIVTGENVVYYFGTVSFTVTKYIEVDFGPGWQNLVVTEPLRPGTSGIYSVYFDTASTYIYVTGNTNIDVQVGFKIPNNAVYLQNMTIYVPNGVLRVTRDKYDIIAHIPAGEPYDSPRRYIVPTAIMVGIDVPSGTLAGGYGDQFIICVAEIGSLNQVCPNS